MIFRAMCATLMDLLRVGVGSDVNGRDVEADGGSGVL